MPTVTMTKTAQCTGGRHVTLVITGAWEATKHIHIDNVLSRTLTEDERDQLLELWLRVHCAGKTLGQLNTEFTNGVTAVI